MSLFSSHWYRVENLKLQLAEHCQVHRNVQRGQLWYVLQNGLTGQYFRITPTTYQIVGLMDGRRKIGQIWSAASGKLGDDLPKQDEVISLLSRLHRANMLRTDNSPDISEMADRHKSTQRQQVLQKIKSPFSMRFSIFDPDHFLTFAMPYVRPVFTIWGLLLFSGLLCYASVQAALHWPELTHNLVDRVLAFENILLMVLTYPLVKAAHELGHGFAVKNWGGSVHEIGVMFIIFIPVPYVDASAATGWPDKWCRVVVGAMGILVELALSAIALLVLVSVEPGWVSAIAFSVIVTGGISTLMFNGNPLLRFDGYYVFSDILEIPNLGKRSNDYLGYSVKKYLYGVEGGKSPAYSQSEAIWFVFYAIAAFIYRLFMVAAIILLVFNYFFYIGGLLALLAIWQMVLLPIGKLIHHLLSDEAIMKKRRRAWAVTMIAATIFGGLVSLVPLPYAFLGEGIVWLPEESKLVASGSGFISQINVKPGDKVEPQTRIIDLSNADISTHVTVLKGQIRALEAKADLMSAKGPSALAQAREHIESARAALKLAEDRAAELSVISRIGGIFVTGDKKELAGRFARKGDLLGYVIDPSSPVRLRIVVPEENVDLVRTKLKTVDVQFARDADKTYKATLIGEIPAAQNQLPSLSVSTTGGGSHALDPSSKDQLKSLHKIFIFEALVKDPPPLNKVEERALIRFSFEPTPLLFQLYRPIRQLLLRQIKI